MKKKYLSLLMAALLIVMACVTACSSGGGDDGGEAEIPTYVVVTEPTAPPFDMTDDDGNVIGFDIELLQAIAEDQGFNIEVMTIEFDALIPALEAGNGDIVNACTTVTEERELVVDFCDPYYESSNNLLVKSDNTEITGFESFTEGCGYKIAAQMGTECADEAMQMKEDGLVADVVLLNQTNLCIQQLQNGDVDAVLIDKPIGQGFIDKTGDELMFVGEPYVGSHCYFAMAVAEGNDELREKINAGLKNVMANGTYDALCEKWGIVGIEH